MRSNQFLNYLIAMLGALVVFVVVIIVLANILADDGDKPQDPMVAKVTSGHIKPAGQVNTRVNH